MVKWFVIAVVVMLLLASVPSMGAQENTDLEVTIYKPENEPWLYKFKLLFISIVGVEPWDIHALPGDQIYTKIMSYNYHEKWVCLFTCKNPSKIRVELYKCTDSSRTNCNEHVTTAESGYIAYGGKVDQFVFWNAPKEYGTYYYTLRELSLMEKCCITHVPVWEETVRKGVHNIDVGVVECKADTDCKEDNCDPWGSWFCIDSKTRKQKRLCYDFYCGADGWCTVKTTPKENIESCPTDYCGTWGQWTCRDTKTLQRTRTCYTYTCSGGSCQVTSRMETDTKTCPTDYCEAWSSWTCRDTTTLQRTRTCYTYTCIGSTCQVSSTTETQTQACFSGYECKNNRCVEECLVSGYCTDTTNMCSGYECCNNQIQLEYLSCCGDGICEIGEDNYNCPTDCLPGVEPTPHYPTWSEIIDYLIEWIKGLFLRWT